MNHVLVLHCCKNQEQQQQLPHLGKSIIKQLLNIDQQNLNLQKNEKIACFDHLIQTKYYDATLSFSLLTLTVDSILNENSSSDYLMNSLLSLNHHDSDDASSKSYHPHALILTFDDEMMHRECDQLSQALNKCIQICRSKFHQNLEVCLCVSLQHVSDRENFYAALNELTIDEQFELVRQQQQQSQELTTEEEEEEASDSIFEEKFGSDRVWEALKSTMWPHMDKPTLSQPQQQQAPVYSDNTGEESSQHDKEMLALEELMSQVFQTEEDLESDEEQSTEPLKSSPVETTTTTSTSTTQVPVQQEKTKTGANPEVDDAQQFDQLLQAMLHMRRNAGSMVDQDRKQRAADLAMSLLSMLDAEK